MRRCSKCNTFKDNSYFTKNSQLKSGLNRWCKDCTRRNSRNGYFKYKSKRIESIKKWRMSEKGKQVYEQSIKKWVNRNPKKYVAHYVVSMAIKHGILHPRGCERCDSIVSQAHHEDYDKPYEVIWLCPQCHKDRHQEIKNSKPII